MITAMSNFNPMTWQQVKDQLDRLTPAQLSQEAIIFDSESNNYIALIQGQIATEADAGDVISGSSSTTKAGQLYLLI